MRLGQKSALGSILRSNTPERLGKQDVSVLFREIEVVGALLGPVTSSDTVVGQVSRLGMNSLLLSWRVFS